MSLADALHAEFQALRALDEPVILVLPVPSAAPSAAAGSAPPTTALPSPAPAVVVALPALPVAATAPAPRPPLAVDRTVVPTREELRVSEAKMRELEDTNDRIMAQNIALLREVEVMQRQVLALRAEKAALAVQLRRHIA